MSIRKAMTKSEECTLTKLVKAYYAAEDRKSSRSAFAKYCDYMNQHGYLKDHVIGVITKVENALVA